MTVEWDHYPNWRCGRDADRARRIKQDGHAFGEGTVEGEMALAALENRRQAALVTLRKHGWIPVLARGGWAIRRVTGKWERDSARPEPPTDTHRWFFSDGTVQEIEHAAARAAREHDVAVAALASVRYLATTPEDAADFAIRAAEALRARLGEW